MESIGILAYLIQQLTQTWPGIVVLLLIVAVLVIVFRDELMPMVQPPGGPKDNSFRSATGATLFDIQIAQDVSV